MDKRLFVFTASGKEPEKHYINSIVNGFSLESIEDCLSVKEFKDLQFVYLDRPVRAWGAAPGKDNIPNWNKLRPSDSVIVYRKGYYEYYGFVAFKVRNQKLAEKMWGRNEENITWEYIYFLDNLVKIHVPAREYNKLLGHKLNHVQRGFRSVNKQKINSLIRKYGSVENFLESLVTRSFVSKTPTLF